MHAVCQLFCTLFSWPVLGLLNSLVSPCFWCLSFVKLLCIASCICRLSRIADPLIIGIWPLPDLDHLPAGHGPQPLTSLSPYTTSPDRVVVHLIEYTEAVLLNLSQNVHTS